MLKLKTLKPKPYKPNTPNPEAQTYKLLEVCQMRQTPIMTFMNKMDREGREPIELLDEIEEKHQVRYFMKENDILKLSDTNVAVCTQWGIDNITPFIDACKSLGLEIN